MVKICSFSYLRDFVIKLHKHFLSLSGDEVIISSLQMHKKIVQRKYLYLINSCYNWLHYYTYMCLLFKSVKLCRTQNYGSINWIPIGNNEDSFTVSIVVFHQRFPLIRLIWFIVDKLSINLVITLFWTVNVRKIEISISKTYLLLTHDPQKHF